MNDDDYMDAVHTIKAWFVGRMATDHWYFAIHLVNGDVVIANSIIDVQESPGGIWIDVMLGDYVTSRLEGFRQIHAVCNRRDASINAAHIVAVYEIADT